MTRQTIRWLILVSLLIVPTWNGGARPTPPWQLQQQGGAVRYAGRTTFWWGVNYNHLVSPGMVADNTVNRSAGQVISTSAELAFDPVQGEDVTGTMSLGIQGAELGGGGVWGDCRGEQEYKYELTGTFDPVTRRVTGAPPNGGAKVTVLVISKETEFASGGFVRCPDPSTERDLFGTLLP